MPGFVLASSNPRLLFVLGLCPSFQAEGDPGFQPVRQNWWLGYEEHLPLWSWALRLFASSSALAFLVTKMRTLPTVPQSKWRGEVNEERKKSLFQSNYTTACMHVQGNEIAKGTLDQYSTNNYNRRIISNSVLLAGIYIVSISRAVALSNVHCSTFPVLAQG